MRQSLDQKTLAKYLRENTHQTIIRSGRLFADGEWKKPRRWRLNSAHRGQETSISSALGKQVILFPDRIEDR